MFQGKWRNNLGNNKMTKNELKEFAQVMGVCGLIIGGVWFFKSNQKEKNVSKTPAVVQSASVQKTAQQNVITRE